MKKVTIILLIIITAMSLSAQEPELNTAQSDRYQVYSEISLSHAQETADKLEAYFDLFNSYFHFPEQDLPATMKVRIFSDKEGFDAYLEQFVPEAKSSFVFLQYSDPEKSELVGYWSEGQDFDRYLAHHSFLQFLKTFIPNPPLWLQKGFAVYFETVTYDAEEESAELKENLGWVDTLKSYISEDTEEGLIPFPTLLSLDVESANANLNRFYSQSWGLVYFLLNSPVKAYNRILWDSISAMEADNTRKENEAAVIRKAFEWVLKRDFDTAFKNYISSLRTFPDVVEDGMSLYASAQYDRAEMDFINAISLRKDHPVPYYYMGLIKYARQDYLSAEYYYEMAIQRGSDPGITYYALGVNAFADGRISDAVKYLTMAHQADPLGYGERAVQLLLRIDSEYPEENVELPEGTATEEPAADDAGDGATPDVPETGDTAEEAEKSESTTKSK